MREIRAKNLNYDYARVLFATALFFSLASCFDGPKQVGRTASAIGVCGDGTVDRVDGEECDDGDLDPGDGCNGSCDVEDQYACGGDPYACNLHSECVDGSNQDTIDNKDYFFCTYEDQDTWLVSRAHCLEIGKGWRLARIDSATEMTFIGTLSDTQNAFIGARYRATTDQWVWSDGHAFWNGGSMGSPVGANYSNWDPGGNPGSNPIGPEPQPHPYAFQSFWSVWRTSFSVQGYVCESPSLLCGDGDLDASPYTIETCDDGDNDVNDDCPEGFDVDVDDFGTCEPAHCSDGFLKTTDCAMGEPCEACDDGDEDNGDGCNSNCLIENDFPCTADAECASNICDFTEAIDTCQPANNCGNGRWEVGNGEQCDDGANGAGDGCNDACMIEHGWECMGVTSVCMNVCGNGEIGPGEGCDDDNVAAGDGCDATCQIEPGYTCMNEPSECSIFCGNGSVNFPETCDDQNGANGDGCSNVCQTEHGYQCSGDPSVCFSTCGDGEKAADEECDDDNTMPNDGCTSDCELEPGFNCTAGDHTSCDNICSDGIIVSGEQCDDENSNSNDGCSASCQIEHGYTCELGFSQNFTIDGGAGIDCVDGPSPADPTASLTPVSLAPNNYRAQWVSGCVNLGGLLLADDSYLPLMTVFTDSMGTATFLFGQLPPFAYDTLNDCTSATNNDIMVFNVGMGATVYFGLFDDPDGAKCGDNLSSSVTFHIWDRSVCTSECGDGEVASDEECDDDDTSPGDGCDADCNEEDGWNCSGEASTCVAAECGDGIVAGAEACDDDNTDDGDGCDDSCMEEHGYNCTGSPSDCESECGDGEVASDEECDDDNTDTGDGCDADCDEEDGFMCMGEPSTCVGTCGDGMKVAGEGCDDGNLTNDDGCNGVCKIEDDEGGCVIDGDCESGVCNESTGICLPNAQGTIAGGGFCSLDFARSTNERFSWLLLFMTISMLVIRRRRSLVAKHFFFALLVSVGVVHATPAAAQFDLNQFRPSEKAHDGFTIDSADDLGHMRFGVQLYTDYSDDPLVFEDVSGSTLQLVHQQLTVHLQASLGLFNRVIVYFGLPYHAILKEDTSDDFSTLALAGIAPLPRGQGLGDAWLGARVRILGERKDIFQLGAQGTININTAGLADEKGTYRGGPKKSPSIGGHPELLFSVNLFKARLRFNTNVGYRVVPKDNRFTFQDAGGGGFDPVTMTDQLTYGAGGIFEILRGAHGLDTLLEAFGRTGLGIRGSAGFGNREESPLELIGGLKYHHYKGYSAGVGGGVGLTGGVGSPDFRAFAMLGYTLPEKDNDADDDGIEDKNDKCPAQAEDMDGFEDTDGCPDADNDGDGVDDAHDKCQGELEDKDGFQDDDGCPEADNDGDGVDDANDKCPTEAGVPENKGCPDHDRDGDGLVDRLDNCPDVAGTKEFYGCGEPQLVQIGDAQLEILEKIYFDTASTKIQKRSFALLNNVAAVIKAHPEITKIRVEGHTDSRGPDAYNLTLSQGRAESVAEYLVWQGIDKSRLEAIGHGETKPIVPDATSAQDHGKNRRVEFNIGE